MPFWPFTASASAQPTTTSTSPTSPTTHPRRRRRSSTSSVNPPPSARYNLTITPSSPEFLSALATFRTLLRSPSHTFTSILAAKFTPYERALLTPATSSSFAGSSKGKSVELAAIQEENKERYKALLDSERFREYRGQADLGFRLTMAWFGLPVGPVGVEGRRQWMGWGDESDGEDGMDRGDIEGEGLRFLGGYRGRGFESGGRRGRLIFCLLCEGGSGVIRGGEKKGRGCE